MFNLLLRMLSYINEKYGGRELYVKFCDGKYHWARLEERNVYDATGKLIQEQTYTSIPYKYEYEGHLIKGYYLNLPQNKQTKLYSEDSKKILYLARYEDGTLCEESWPIYNEQQNPLKICWEKEAIFFTYNENGILSQSKVYGPWACDAQYENGLMVSFNFDFGSGYCFTEYEYDTKKRIISEKIIIHNYYDQDESENINLCKRYEYDDEDNLIRANRSDGEIELYRTIFDYENGNRIKKICRFIKSKSKKKKKTLAEILQERANILFHNKHSFS